MGRSLRIVRGSDGGKTWTDLPTLPYEEGRPFVVDGQLLMFVQEQTHRDFQIVTSDDRGETWTEPRTVIEGPLWNISTAQVIRPDALYWAMDRDSAGVDYRGKVMVLVGPRQVGARPRRLVDIQHRAAAGRCRRS